MSLDEPKPRSAESRLAWARLWARYIDLSLYTVPVAVLTDLLIPGMASANAAVFAVVTFPPVLLIDAVVIGTFGTSIGKFIAGVKVLGLSDTPPGVRACLRRNVRIYLVLAFGIPLIALPILVFEYFGLRRSGSTSWDRSADTRVVSAGSTPLRTINAALVYVALFVGVAVLAASR